MSKKPKSESPQVEQVSKNVLANMSIEELEQRLEMQILSLPAIPDTCKKDCGTFCNPII